MNQLGLIDITEHRLDLRRRPADDARCFLCAVVDEAARDLASVRCYAADDLAATEVAGDGDDADRQQALAVLR